MTFPYFNQVPNFNYISQFKNAQIGDYVEVKNFFKRVKLREDIFEDIVYFTKYKIMGDDRPDNVAHKFYDDSSLDWMVLLANNIINIQTEWPMQQTAWDSYLLDKYSNYPSGYTSEYDWLYNGVHHYESIELKNSNGVTLLPTGTTVKKGYSYKYYDSFSDSQIETGDISTPVTNWDHEYKIENDKRNIYLLKVEFLGTALDDIDEIMKYKKGSSTFISKTLKNADNSRLTT